MLTRLTALALLWTLASFPMPASAQPTLPAGAKKLLGEQIRQHLGDRTFRFVVHDAKVEASGTSTWDLKSQTVSGDYVWGGRSGKWKKQWKIVDDKNCIGDGANKPWECQNIFVDGDVHYEVRDDGVIHGVNTTLAK
jgi:hypothetical protein